MKQETQSEKYENNLFGLGGHKKCEKKSVKHWNHERQIEKDTNSTFLPEGWIRRIFGRLGVGNWDSVVKSLISGFS